MFWQRHEFAVFSKETTVAGRYIYIYYHHRSSNLLSLLFPPSKTLIPGRIKVFGTKLHRESSIHAGMFFFFLVCSSNFSLAFPSPLVNYLSLPLCFCVWLHIVAHSERSPWIRQLRRILPPLVKSHRAKKKKRKARRNAYGRIKVSSKRLGGEMDPQLLPRLFLSVFQLRSAWIKSSFDFSFFLFVCWLDRGVREGEGVGDR